MSIIGKLAHFVSRREEGSRSCRRSVPLPLSHCTLPTDLPLAGLVGLVVDMAELWSRLGSGRPQSPGSELVVHAQADDVFVETACRGKHATAARVAGRVLEASVKILSLTVQLYVVAYSMPAPTVQPRFGAAPGQCRRRRLDVGEGATAGDVVQYLLGGIADPATYRGEPVAGGVTAANHGEGTEAASPGIAEILPIDGAFGAEHEFADLIIAANLAAGHEAVDLVACHRSERCTPDR